MYSVCRITLQTEYIYNGMILQHKKQVRKEFLRIYRALQQRHVVETIQQYSPLDQFEYTIRQLQQVIHYIRMYQQYHCTSVVSQKHVYKIYQHLFSMLYLCQEYRAEVQYQQTPQQTNQQQCRSIHDLYADLIDLQHEFKHVRFENKDNEFHLIVTTFPITLLYKGELFDFGEFEIHLELNTVGLLPDDIVLDVFCVALTPNNPSNYDDVTHPHVRDNCLCCGEAKETLRFFISNAFIYEYFIVVRQTLLTYNSSSPHVSLDKWNGIGCYNCGSMVDEESGDGGNCCSDCGCVFCDYCLHECTSCFHFVCDCCSYICDICGKRTCSYCCLRCKTCNKIVCNDHYIEPYCTQCNDTHSDDSQDHENDDIDDDDDDDDYTIEVDSQMLGVGGMQRASDPQSIREGHSFV